MSDEWATATLRVNLDGGITFYCWCKRKLRELYDGSNRFYCRKHGLQATIENVRREPNP